MIAERTDESKLAALLAGEALHFPEGATKADRRVRAEWIVEAVRVGVPLDIAGAIVDGELDLSGRFIPVPVSFSGCTFGALDLADTKFAKAARFEECDFTAGLAFTRTRFEDEAALIGNVLAATSS